MDDQELKVCPFCGGDAHIQQEDYPETWWVGCEKNVCVSTDTHVHLEEAIATWNTRAEPVGVPTVQAGDVTLAAIAEQIAEVVRHNRVNGTYTSLSAAIHKLDLMASNRLSAAPSQPVADHTEQHLAMVPSDEQTADCYSHNDGDSWCDCPDDIVFVHGLKVGDEYEVLASVRAWPERYRVTKAPDDDSDDYEVELLTTANAGKDATPTYTTGHCENNKQPGGCQQHNLHCGWPKCDQKEINHA